MASNKISINLMPIPQIELHLTGEWVKVEDLTSGIGQSIQKGYDRGIGRFTTLVINKVKNAIRSGRPPSGSQVYWPPLSQAYIDRLKSKFPDHHIYSLTGLYERSIGIYRYKNRTILGLPYKNKPGNNRATTTLNQVAIILEYGSKDGSIPSRPLWKPSLKSVGGIKRIKKEVMHGIRSQLHRDFGINPKQIR